MPNYKQMVQDLLTYALLYHPLPWHIESDWTAEVTAADGFVVAKCRTAEHAQALIDEATRLQAKMVSA